MRTSCILLTLLLAPCAASAQAVDTLVASDGSIDFFGYAVDIDGDVAVVGAPIRDTNTGAAYVYRFDGSSWNEEAKLTAPDATQRMQFAYDVAISGDVIAVAANYDSERAYRAGAVYVYRHDGTNWVLEQKVLPPEGTPASSQFGWCVDIEGDRLAGGAVGDDDLGAFAGAALVYRYDAGSWVMDGKLTASDGAASDQFGYSIAIKQDVIAVGVPMVDDAAGAVYIYRLADGTWSEEYKISALEGKALDMFGWSLDINEEQWVIAGARRGTGVVDASGTAYVYKRTGPVWSITGWIMQASNGEANQDFGWSVALHGTTAAVGATKAKKPGQTVGTSGAVYVFELVGGQALEKNILYSPIEAAGENFGFSVAAHESDLLVGATHATVGTNSTTGAAFVYANGLQTVGTEDITLVSGYTLHQNYPNPFNPRTTIDFSLPAPAQVRLSVHDLLGRTVSVLIDGPLAPGSHSAVFEAGDLPSGLYVYRLETAATSISRSLVLLK